MCWLLIVKMASYGLVHCDFNEFNLLVTDESKVIMIDFPQMVSTNHDNAKMYFERDVECIRTFFRKRFRYVSEAYPKFETDCVSDVNLAVLINVEASGFDHKMQKKLEKLQKEQAEEEIQTDENEQEEEYEDRESDEDAEETE